MIDETLLLEIEAFLIDLLMEKGTLSINSIIDYLADEYWLDKNELKFVLNSLRSKNKIAINESQISILESKFVQVTNENKNYISEHYTILNVKGMVIRKSNNIFLNFEKIIDAFKKFNIWEKETIFGKIKGSIDEQLSLTYLFHGMQISLNISNDDFHITSVYAKPHDIIITDSTKLFKQPDIIAFSEIWTLLRIILKIINQDDDNYLMVIQNYTIIDQTHGGKNNE